MTGGRERFTELGYAMGWRLVRLAPPRLAAWAGDRAADRVTSRGGRGVHRLERNLRTVVGPDMPESEFQQLMRSAVRSYARYWLEFFRLPNLTPSQVLDRFTVVDGLEHLEAGLAGGAGVVLALPHMANWDAAGAWLAARGWPVTTVAERLKPEGLFERFLAARRRLGMEILPLTGGDQPVLETLADRLRRGTIVPLVADRDLSARGVPVRFFGRPATMPPGPALLALRTGAPLMTVSLWFGDDRLYGRVDPPLVIPPEGGSVAERVQALTQLMADRFAESIAEHPADWHMMQRVWRDPVARPAAGAGAGR